MIIDWKYGDKAQFQGYIGVSYWEDTSTLWILIAGLRFYAEHIDTHFIADVLSTHFVAERIDTHFITDALSTHFVAESVSRHFIAESV